MGWQFVAPISDALLVAPTGPMGDDAEEDARCAMEAVGTALMGVPIRVKIDHYPRY